jgi:uncharacterized protein YchJ
VKEREDLALKDSIAEISKMVRQQGQWYAVDSKEVRRGREEVSTKGEKTRRKYEGEEGTREEKWQRRT